MAAKPTKKVEPEEQPKKVIAPVVAPIDPTMLVRRNRPKDVEIPPEPPPAANALRASVVELAFNPTREKIREVTIVDRMQGRLLPLLDLESQGWDYVIEVAAYRQDSNLYKEIFKKSKPSQIDLIETYTYRLAQWQKSVAGKNLERATDIALAETENKAEEKGDDGTHGDPWKDG